MSELIIVGLVLSTFVVIVYYVNNKERIRN